MEPVQIKGRTNGSVSDEKLKILAIHGYRQNSESFRQKTGSFRKIVNFLAKFTFITAPHKVIPINDAENVNNEQSEDGEQYGWFFNRDDNSFRGTREGGPAIGFDDSVNLIEKTFEEEGPFDGIWGFSQGASFVALLCDLQQKKLLKAKFNFAIMVAGFKSGSLVHSHYFNEPIKIPTLHVFGENDQIIPSWMSESLAQNFLNPEIVKHSGGHYVPASPYEVKDTYRNFFKRMRQLKIETLNEWKDSSRSKPTKNLNE